MAAYSPLEDVTSVASDFDSRAEEHPGALSGNSRDQVVDTVSSNGDAHVPPTSAAPLENGSKRKKKHKRKKTPKSEADKRFDTVLQQLKSRDSDELWLSLGSCDLHDARMGALTEALAHNSTVTALDLSRNNITSQGAQARALLEALGSGAASDLIELDMRGNPFTPEHLKNLAHLWASRRQLTVLAGALRGPSNNVSVSPFALQANQVDAEEEEEEEDESSEGELDYTGANGYTSPLIRQFFQVGSGEDAAMAEASEPQQPPEEPDVMAERLWGQVTDSLQEEDVSANAALSEALRSIVTAVQEEMASCALPMLDSTTAEDLKPHTAHALRHVPLLPPILDRVPPPVLWPTSAGVPQAAVGSHRLEVASLVAALLGAGSVVLDEAVACSGALPRLVHLCFAHPACNALHAALLRLLQSAFSSRISGLWTPLLEHGMGIACPGNCASSSAVPCAQPPAATAAEEQGSAAACAPPQRPEGGPAPADRPTPPPLQRQLAAVGIAAADMPGGRRPPITGFAVAVAQLLKAHAAEGPASGILQQRLEVSAEWLEYSEADGALDQVIAEQAGELCGPRPLTCKTEGLQRLRSFRTADELSSWQEQEPPVAWHVPGQTGGMQQHDGSGWECLGSRNTAPQEGQQHGSCASQEALRWEAAAMGAAALQADEEWADFAEEGGGLQRLLAEQEGELCGPRPRPPVLHGLGGSSLLVAADGEGNALQNGAGANSYLLNCRDLASYLQHMPRLSGTLRST